METLLLALLRGLIRGLNALGPSRARALVRCVINVFLITAPRHRKIALRNLKMAFPEKDETWRRAIAEGSIDSFARMVVDSARLFIIDGAWVSAHVECPMVERFKKVKEAADSGVILATGHLGSFDLLGAVVPYLAGPIAFVVRNFELKKIDHWWTSVREQRGNKVINRKGALKEAIEVLRQKKDVAVLIDQNVRDKHGVFVDWFGIPAATSKLVGIAALRTSATIFVASMEHLGNERYRINAVECNIEDVRSDPDASPDEKVLEITKRVSAAYEAMIRARPEEWFWMHRRWRTRPKGEAHDLYADLG